MTGTGGINLEEQIQIYYKTGMNLPLVFKTSLGTAHLMPHSGFSVPQLEGGL